MKRNWPVLLLLLLPQPVANIAANESAKTAKRLPKRASGASFCLSETEEFRK
jgi:hypothetical protein